MAYMMVKQQTLHFTATVIRSFVCCKIDRVVRSFVCCRIQMTNRWKTWCIRTRMKFGISTILASSVVEIEGSLTIMWINNSHFLQCVQSQADRDVNQIFLALLIVHISILCMLRCMLCETSLTGTPFSYCQPKKKLFEC